MSQVISDEDKEKAAEGGDGGVGTPTLSTAPMAQNRTIMTPAPITEPKGSGSFQNLNKFIEANKGRSEQFAGEVTGNLESKVKTGLEGVKSAVGTQVANIQSQAETFNPMENQFTPGTAGYANLQKWFTKPTKIAAPAASQDVITAEEGLKNTGTLISGTGTQAGLGAVTKDLYKQKGLAATTGESAFDRLLLGKDVAAKEKFANLRSQVPTIAENVATEKAKIGEAATGVQQTLEKEKAKAMAAVKAEQDRINANIEASRLALQKKQREDLLAALDQGGGIKMDVTDDIAYESGINNLISDYGAAVGGPMTPYLQGSRNITREQAMTPEQAAQLNALAALSGGPAISPESIGGYVPVSFNREAWQGQINAQRDAEEKQRQLDASLAELNRLQTEGMTAEDYKKYGGDVFKGLMGGGPVEQDNSTNAIGRDKWRKMWSDFTS